MSKRKITCLIVSIILLITQGELHAQTVQVSVKVLPPISNKPKNYIENGNNVVVTLISNVSGRQPVRIIPSLIGSNGVKIAVKDNFIPAMPIVLLPNQVRSFTLNQLKVFNSNLNFSDLLIQGISETDYIQNGKLPEGIYSMCFKIMDYTSGAVIGNANACGIFNLISYDVPMIINPANNSQVYKLQPQLVNFNWTVSGQAGLSRYQLKLVDLTANNLLNANDAFSNPNILPTFQQNNIVTNAFVYDLSKPKLIDGHKYAVQVVAYDPLGNASFKNNGKSQVTTFTYAYKINIINFPVLNNQPNNQPNNEQPDPAPGNCIADTKWQGDLKKQNVNNLPDGTNILLGKFVMRNTKFTKTNGGYDGKGEIAVNFLHAKIMVEFKAIKINADKRMYEGSVTGKVTSNTIINDAMSKVKSGILDKVPDMDELTSLLEKNTRNVANLTLNGPAQDLPLHIDNDNFNLGIVGIIFEPTEAYVNSVLVTEVPQTINSDYLLLSSKGIRVHPNGFGEAAVKVSLAKNVAFNLSNNVQLAFESGAAKTFATFDCSGFKDLTVSGSLQLSRNIALPVKNYEVINDQAVKVSVPFKLQNIKGFEDFMVSKLSFSHPFVIPDARDLVLNATDITLDFSSSKNSSDLETAYANLKNKKDWIGLFVKNISLTLPSGFKKKGGGRITINANNALVDKQGFSGELIANGGPLAEGGLAGLNFKLDQLNLKIDKSKLAGGGLGGNISLPLGDKANFGFEALISKGDNNGANFSFSLETQDEIEANLFLAKLKLFKGSSIDIKKINGDFSAAANLSGEISVNFADKPSNSNVGKFELPKLKFEQLVINTKNNAVPDFDLKFVSLQNQKGIQAKISNAFELNLNDLQFKKSADKKSVGIGMKLGLSLFGGDNKNSNGAGASAGFTIWAKHNGSTFKYDKAQLDAIAIKADLGAAYIEGSIEIYNQDQKYGNGFRGHVLATLSGISAGLEVTVQFGRTLQDKGNYKYWYFDAMLDLPNPGLNIPGTVASIYGFGGGAWCNMARVGGEDVIKPDGFKAVNKEGGAPTTSGVTFEPQLNSAGFKAGILFGITGSKEAFNGDLTFSMEFNSKTLAVNHVLLEGNAYLMQNPNNSAKRDPSKAFLYCNAKIEYDRPTNVLSGNFGAHLNIANIIEGGGELAFKFDMPDKDQNGKVINPKEVTKWFIKVGQWTPGVDPFEDNARIHAKIGFDAKVVKAEIKFQTYFMLGNDLPNTLPPMPDYIYQMVKDEGMAEKTKPLPNVVGDAQNLAIAFGAGLKLKAGFDFFVIKADLEAAAGFDVLLANVNGTCDGTPIGFNGWYAQGQAYAYLKGDIKLFRSIPLAEFVAGAVLQVKLPNPNWVRGDIVAYIDVLGIDAGEYHGSFEKGTLCKTMKVEEFDPFKNVKLIKSVEPANNAKSISPYDKFKVKLAYSYGYGGVGSHINSYDAFNAEELTYRFQAIMHLKDKNGKEVPIQVEYSDENPRVVKIVPKEILNEKSQYTIEVFANAINDKYKNNGKKETVKVSFTTGSYPTEIKMNDIGDAYPVPFQRYAMKKDSEGKAVLGRLDVKKDMTYFATKYQKDYNLIIRFREAGTSNMIDVKYDKFDNDPEIKKHENSLIYTLPQNLKNSTVYKVSLILKPKPKNQNGNLGDLQNSQKTIFEGYYFKTSKYNSFKEKYADYELKKVGYIPFSEYNSTFYHDDIIKSDDMIFNYQLPILLIQGKESMDVIEYEGYKASAQQTKFQGGKLWYGGENSNWMKEMAYKYANLNTNLISKTEREHLKSLGDFGSHGDNNFYVKYDDLTPFAGMKQLPFSGLKTAFWMKNINWYVDGLKKKKTLGANETIAKPDGLLTQAEIDAAVNGKGSNGQGFAMNNNKKFNGNNEQKSYWALIDATGYKAVLDKSALDNKRLKNSKAADQVWKTWKILKKMGWPVYSNGNHTLNMYMSSSENNKQLPFKVYTYWNNGVKK